jgi:hemerythrin
MTPSTNDWIVTIRDESNDPFVDGSLAGDQPTVMAKAVVDDHAELVRAANALRDRCELACKGRAQDLARFIEEFQERLLIHFAAEESEEFLGSLVRDQPGLLKRAQRLQDEHGEIAFVLECLVGLAATDPREPEVAALTIRFLDRFEVHEHAENALLQELVLTDEGGVD